MGEPLSRDPSERNMTQPGEEQQKAMLAMLDAREERWNLRLALSGRYDSLLTMTLCIPLPFRTEAGWKAFLLRQADRFAAYAESCGAAAEKAAVLEGADGTAVFYGFRCSGEALKKIAVAYENLEPSHRLLDADVMEKGRAIGRAELKLPPRRCFLCSRNAADCVSASRHSPEEIALYLRTVPTGK